MMQLAIEKCKPRAILLIKICSARIHASNDILLFISIYLYLYIFKNDKLYNLLTLETDPDNIL